MKGSPLIASKLLEKHLNIPSPKFKSIDPAMRTSSNFKAPSQYEMFEKLMMKTSGVTDKNIAQT